MKPIIRLFCLFPIVLQTLAVPTLPGHIKAIDAVSLVKRGCYSKYDFDCYCDKWGCTEEEDPSDPYDYYYYEGGKYEYDCLFWGVCST